MRWWEIKRIRAVWLRVKISFSCRCINILRNIIMNPNAFAAFFIRISPPLVHTRFRFSCNPSIIGSWSKDKQYMCQYIAKHHHDNSLKNILSIIKLHYLWSWFVLKEPILNAVISPECLGSIAVEYGKELCENIFCCTPSNFFLSFDGFIILYIGVPIRGVHVIGVSEPCFDICFIYVSG